MTTNRRRHAGSARRRVAGFGRFIASLTALAVVTVGVPALLVVCSKAGLGTGNPLPGLGSLEEIRSYFERSLTVSEISPITLRVLLIAGWLLWAAMVVSVAASIVETTRGRSSVLPQFALFRGLGRWIATGLMALTAAAPSIISAAPLPTVTAYAVPAAGTPTLGFASGLRTTPVAGATLRTGYEMVRPGESIAAFAQRMLGDSARWNEIWELNRQRPVGPHGEIWAEAWKIAAGSELQLPASITSAATVSAPTSTPRRTPTAPTLAHIVTSRPTDTPADNGGRAVDQHRVVAGDTYWSIAEAHLGPGASSVEVSTYTHLLMDFNAELLGYSDPAMLQPGDVISIIDTTTTTPPARDTDQPATVSVDAPDDRGTTTPHHVVVAGDSYWSIAELRALELHGPDHALATVVYDLMVDLIDLNAPRLDYADREMIHPGDIVYLADPATPPDTPPAETLPAETPTPPIEPDIAISVTPPAPLPTEPSTSAPPTTADSPPTTTAPASTTTADDGSAAETAGDSRVPIAVGIAGATVLATAVAGRMTWLRRRRLTRGAAHSFQSASPLERAVYASADTALVRWAGQHLARLVAGLDRRQLTAAPIAVELSEHAGIELLWDQPQAARAPSGWVSADGGWAWRQAYDPDDPTPTDELPAAIPALVTVGRRDDRQLLIDLEALGLVAVTGPKHRVDDFLRSVAAELALGVDVADSYVTTLDLRLDVDPGTGRLTASNDIDDAIDHLQGIRDSVADALQRAGIDDTFLARAGSSTPIETTIAVIGHATAADLIRLGDVGRPRRGIAAVVASDQLPADVAHIDIAADGTARLEPLGVSFNAAALPDETVTELDVAFAELSDHATTDTADHTLFNPAAPTSEDEGHAHLLVHPQGALDLKITTTENPPVDDEGVARPSVEMVVRVLGVPRIEQRPALGRRELILAVLLACRGGTLAATAAQDALWGGRAVEPKTVWNLVAKTRSALGDFDDGTTVMPSADRTRGTLRLDPRVTTDLTMLVERLERSRDASSSEAIALLREALELVEGPPFDAAGYDWAHRDQDVAYAATAIEQTAEALVQLALEAGLVDVARDGLRRALLGLPGDEQLYRARMRVEHHAGNRAGVIAAFDELRNYLDDLDTEPSPVTIALHNELTQRQPTSQ